MISSMETSLSDLFALGENWDGRGSAAPSPKALETAADMKAVPLGSGGIQLEMHVGGVDLEIEIDQNGRVIGVSWSRPS